jgi:hypothetical protein
MANYRDSSNKTTQGKTNKNKKEITKTKKNRSTKAFYNQT